MVKKIVYSWKCWWRLINYEHNCFVIKLGISMLLLGFGFWFLYKQSFDSSSLSSQNPQISSLRIISAQQGSQKSQISPLPVIFVNSQENITDKIQSPPDQHVSQNTQISAIPIIFGNSSEIIHQVPQQGNEEKCDLFDGDWVPNEAEPLYTNNSCSFIEGHQNCMMNGRPDTGYLYWKWKPSGCDLPQFDPSWFLHLMRNKSWALIGDSISRNHVQSLLCTLSTVEMPNLVYHDENYRSRRWLFPSHNFTVSVIWSPFLVQAEIFEDENGVSTSEIEVILDVLDQNWTEPYKNLDYMIFSSGEWFVKTAIYHENNTILGCHYCPKQNLTELGIDFGYRRALQNFFKYIIASNHKGTIFFRTSTPDHYENGEWYDGGACERKLPAKFELNVLGKILRTVELEEFDKASGEAFRSGVDLRLFDVNPLSLLRPDGHPGPYRFFQPFAKDKNAKVVSDCLHWCLPGPIDTWNDLVLEMVENG